MSAHEDDRDEHFRIERPRLPRDLTVEVPDALVEKAARARWEVQASTFTGYNGDVARTWDALVALFPAQAETRRNVERHALAAVLPEVEAQALEEAAEALDLPGSPATGYYASEQVSGYNDAERDVEAWLVKRAVRLRATTTEEPMT